MLKQQAVILLRNPVKAGERQHPGRQFSGRHLSAGGQGAHGLMVEQAVWKPLCPRRLDEAFFDIELHQCDALDQVPGDHIGEHRPRFRMLLPHYKPHFRRVAPAAGSAHALQKTRDRERRVDLKRPFQPADVDAQLQRCGGADREQRVIVLHFFLGALAIRGGEIPVVDQKALRFMIHFAVLAQALADGLALLAGVGEDQAFLPARMLKDIADARVRRLRRGVGRFFRHRGRGDILFPLVCLRRGVEEVLHAEPPDFFPRFKAGNHGSAAAARGQELPRRLRIADGGGQSDPLRPAPCQSAEPLDQAEGLQAPVSPQQRVDFIDDDEAQVPEQGRDFHVPVDHE